MKGRMCEDVLGAVGNTPLIRLAKLDAGLKPKIYGKLEMVNPGGSVKDRIGMAMIQDAEKRGLLKPGGTIVEPTSGNTGAALAMAAAVLGYRAVFTVPDKVSQEKIDLLKAYGARVVVCPTAVPPESPESFYSVARRLRDEISGAFMPNQYENQVNPEAHYRTTGPEIWEQTAGLVKCVVAGLGTGGTISGVGRFLKEKNPAVRVVGADPLGSIFRDYFYTRQIVEGHTYKVEGIGEDIIPATTHFQYIDDMITITDRESMLTCRRLAREEGILAGGSSGTALAAALKVAPEMGQGEILVVILPDTGDRYLSKVHSDEWMRANIFEGERQEPIARVLSAKSAEFASMLSIGPDQLVREAIDLMEKNGFSQLPVVAEGRQVGSVGEVSLMRRLHDDHAMLEAAVRQVMEEPFPEVNEDADVEEAFQLLKGGRQAVVVRGAGGLKGILTKTDLLHYLRAKE